MFRRLINNLKMFHKILLTVFASVTLVWVILVLTAVSSIRGIYDRKVERIVQQTVEQSSKYVSTEFNNILNLIYYSAIGEEIQSALKLDVSGNARAYVQAESMICPVLTQLQIQNKLIDSTGLYLEGKWFYGDNYHMSYETTDFIKEGSLSRLIYWSDHVVWNQGTKTDVLPVILRVPNGSFSAENEAYMLVNLDADNLFEYIRNLEEKLECRLILHNNGTVIYGDAELYQESKEKDYVLKESIISINNWSLACVIDREQMYADRNAAITNMLLLAVLAASVCYLLAYYISHSIIRPLALLRENARLVEGRDFSVRNHFEGNDEIGDLGRSFDSMCEEIESYIALLEEEKHQVQVTEKQKRRADMQVLQAQINPHFLYNTLDSLYWYSLSGKKDEIGQIVVDLSDMLRIGLSKGAEQIPVDREVRHAEDYLKIQKTIFGDKFEYSIQMEPDVSRYYIIKILLQPLVENSLFHGFHEMEEGGLIRIFAGIQEEELVLRVSDNGCGFGEDRDEEKNEYAGYALHNIEERLKLYYDKDAALRIQSEPYVETTIEIRIKRERLENPDDDLQGDVAK